MRGHSNGQERPDVQGNIVAVVTPHGRRRQRRLRLPRALVEFRIEQGTNAIVSAVARPAIRDYRIQSTLK